jgi:hypothetical protein
VNRLDTFPKKELVHTYRKVFSSGPGQQVLIHMLFELGVFLPVTDGAEDIALKNYGNRLLAILAGGSVGKDSLETFVKRVMRQPLEGQ